MVWSRRSAKLFQIDKRPKRGLFWSKDVYKLWFEYALVSPRNIPPEFGNLSVFKNFNEWWVHPDHGFELFCEPKLERALKVVTAVDESETDSEIIYLRVDLNIQRQNLRNMFRRVLEKHQITTPVQPKSQARFQPSTHERHIKKKALIRYLENWHMRESGMTRKDIFEKRYRNNDFSEDSLRVISREYQRAKQIFENIEKGTFP